MYQMSIYSRVNSCKDSRALGFIHQYTKVSCRHLAHLRYDLEKPYRTASAVFSLRTACFWTFPVSVKQILQSISQQKPRASMNRGLRR